MSLDLQQAVEHIANAAKDPPVLTALLVVLILGFGGGYILAREINAGTQSALEKSLAGEQRHSADLQQIYDQRLAGVQQNYEQRLKGKDDVIEDYRRRLQIAPPKGGDLAQLTNSELKARALQFVSELRKWQQRTGQEEQDQTYQIWSEMRKASRDVGEWQRLSAKIGKLYSDRRAEYDANFKITAILLRDEISSRVPPARRNELKARMLFNAYEDPVNNFGIEDVVTNLEMLAKSLD
jgi:hypothetical protein